MKAIAAFLAAIMLASAAEGAQHPPERPSWRGPSIDHQRQLVREAADLMDEYARRLRAGDRAGIAALYDPDGAVLVMNGQRIYADRPDIARRYADERWQAPTSFEWRTLHYEAVGPDAVVVLGEFAWSDAGGPPATGFYHGLLRRDGDRLFIRIEDETFEAGSG